jgi:hypothetical protein
MCINDLSSFKVGQVSCFPILSHGLSLNTIANSLPWALQGVNKQKKNTQCCKLRFFQCCQHKFYSSILVFPLFCPPMYIRAELSTSICINGCKRLNHHLEMVHTLPKYMARFTIWSHSYIQTWQICQDLRTSYFQFCYSNNNKTAWTPTKQWVYG